MISVVVSIYKRLDNLELILQGLAKQTYKDFEVIVSEDNNAQETVSFVERMRKQHSFAIKHVSQDDNGFRKTRALNQALLASEGEYLVFLDGDCIPHPRLLERYNHWLAPNTVCLGRRCYLNQKLTETLLRENSLRKLNLRNILFNTKRLELAFCRASNTTSKSWRWILGCNWGVCKQALLDVNGFDEDYVTAGVGEDHDVDWRLRKNGTKFINIKFQVIVYHLYHKANYSAEDTAYVNQQLKDKTAAGEFFCKNGLKKHLL